MMKKIIAATTLLVLSQSVVAGPKCAEEQTDQWLSEDAMKAKVAEMGFTYDKFKVSRGNCYEIYGHNEAGEKVEVYFDPISGEIVEQETKS